MSLPLSLKLNILAVKPFTCGTCELADITTLVFPTKQITASVTDVTLVIANCLLIQFTVDKHTAVVTAVDVSDSDTMLYFAQNTMLDAN
jgi:hypothetical protein